MTTLQRGMVLSNNGIIGTQGGSGAPSDNRWNGSWAGTNGTYIDFTSDAANSKLWVKNSGVWFPPNPGFPAGMSLFSYFVTANTPTTTGTYACSSPPPQGFMAMSSGQSNLLAANMANASVGEQYIATSSTYRYLNANPSLLVNNIGNQNFFNSQSGSSVDKFKQTESNLFNGQLAQGLSLNNSVIVVNAVEANHKTYYDLFMKFKNNNFSSIDSSALISIAMLCPGKDGAVVYQARALYNLIYKTLKTYKENCSSDFMSIGRIVNSSPENETLENRWNVELFPNPTDGNFTLVSKSESEKLDVMITDITGKIIYKNTINTINFIINLELDASKGIYLITITNSKNESVSKKLLVTE